MSAMAKAQKGKGDAFVEEAQALLNKKSWFSSGSRNAEDAAEAYEKAANAYKVGALNEEAGNAYMKAAEVYTDKLSDFTAASKCLNSAGKHEKVHHDSSKTQGRPFILTLVSFCRYLLQKEQSCKCHLGLQASSFTLL